MTPPSVCPWGYDPGGTGRPPGCVRIRSGDLPSRRPRHSIGGIGGGVLAGERPNLRRTSRISASARRTVGDTLNVRGRLHGRRHNPGLCLRRVRLRKSVSPIHSGLEIGRAPVHPPAAEASRNAGFMRENPISSNTTVPALVSSKRNRTSVTRDRSNPPEEALWKSVNGMEYP